VNEGPRILDRALPHYVRPELAGQVEFDIDLQRFGYVDTAVSALGRVVQFTIGSVAGAGVVLGARALARGSLERFEHFNVERWLQLALVMPAPMRTTSGSAMNVSAMIRSPGWWCVNSLPRRERLDQDETLWGVRGRNATGAPG
jgi:hypothetical protein